MGKINIAAGFGFPEFLNIGVRYQFSQNQLGVCFGTLPGQHTNFAISGEYFYHFGGLSNLSTQRPWYAKLGFTYYREESEKFTLTDDYLSLRVGRVFNISKKLGIMVDAGAFFTVYSKKIKKDPNASDWNLESPVWPSFGMGLFYRIW
ncbi:MAG: hypothetical protein H8E34_09810 [Bacteroidetes bacterium]|nr:hypothetical protein [Bacteroidota bacterium]MBL6942767.1 hypothetical protein [Bacteroidales bacterium]